MTSLQQTGAAEASAALRILQFAAILLELGGALLIAAIFTVASRASLRRTYFTTWTAAWVALVVAMAAICARYYLLGAAPGSTLPDGTPAVVTLYLLYEGGKMAYWALIWRGALEFTRQAPEPSSRWRWAGGAMAVGAAAALICDALNDLIIIQAPVAAAACAYSAVALYALPRSRRTSGTLLTATVLAVTAPLWAAYFFAFAHATGRISWSMGPLAGLLVRYNSYADMLLLVTLGFSILMLFLEDARARITGAEERLASLVTTAPDPILTIDATQRVTSANPAAVRAFGGPRTGSEVASLVEPIHRDVLRAAISRFSAGDALAEVIGAEERINALRPDGTSFAAEFTISRLHDADLSTTSVLVRDVSSRHALEERRRHESTMEAVRQLAGGLAHDFNNLLTTIVGRIRIVSRTLPPTSPVRDDVTQVEEAAGAAARLSAGLLALSRREPLNPERLLVDDVVRQAIESIGKSAGPGVELVVRTGSANAFAHADRRRLEGALESVVQNAVEASGGVGVVTVETSRALLPQHGGATMEVVSIAVRDRGPGIAAEARDHLFEPFFSTKAEGRGLGLATTWAFMHQSGGTIDVDSGGHGTTVRLHFPLASGQATDRRSADDAPPLAIVPGVRRDRRAVLVAEDEPSVRRSVRKFLERGGITVVDAADGVEALAAFTAAPDEFGLLLTDVMMPQMGGRELTMRCLELRPDLRVVFMSGFLRDPEVLRMVNDRRVRFISKPFDADSLVAVVRGELDADGANVA